MFLPASLLNEASVENLGYGEESEPEPEAEYSGSMDILTENVVKNMMETELFKEFMDSGSGLEEEESFRHDINITIIDEVEVFR